MTGLSTWRRVISSILMLARDALLSLTAKPVRTVGMAAGILLATFSTTAAITIADTQQAQIDRRFDLQRSPAVVLQSSASVGGGFDGEGMAAIRGLEPVSAVGELSIWLDTVEVSVNRFSPSHGGPLIVADAGGLAAAGASIDGVSPDATAIDRPLVWVGARLADQLGISGLSPAALLVAGRPYTLAGLVTDVNGFEYLGSSVIMGRTTARTIQPVGRSERVVASIRPGAADAVAEFALNALDPRRQLALQNLTPPDGEILLTNVAGDLHLIGLALGGFVGLVGVVAVANTMSASVHQRSHELGLRSAMGWSPGRIRNLILIESCIAGLTASVIGCSTGLLCALLWAGWQSWQPVIAPELPALVIVAGTAAALLGGAIPAHRAAMASPLTAMRS